MQGLMDIYMLYSYSRGIEEAKFYNDLADYAFYLSIVMPLIVVSSIFTKSIFLLQPLLGSLTYTWSRANRNQKVSIYFLPIEAKHLPIFYLGFQLLLNGPQSFFSALAGMSAAYLYACIESRSLGPLYSYVCDTLGINVIRHRNSNKVGTIHTMNEVVDGYLVAPNWFKGIVHFFVPAERKFEYNPGEKKSNFQTLKDKPSSNTSGFSLSSMTGSTTFKGKGQKLGS